MRAPFFNQRGFRFRVTPKHLFSGIGKFFGAQDIEIGDLEFDEEFIIKTNNINLARQFFDSTTIKKLIEAIPRIHLEIKDDEGYFGTYYSKTADVLYFQCLGVVKERETLLALYTLFCLLLDKLIDLNVATDQDTGITPK